MTHPNRNWKRRWTLDEAGTTARHETGLVVNWNGHDAVLDNASSKVAGESIAAEDGTDRHVGARVYRLIAEATQLFIKRHQQ